MERQRGDHRADGLLPAVMGGKMGEAAEGAPAHLQAPGQHRLCRPRAPNGDVNPELAEGVRQRDWNAPEQTRRGALLPLHLGAGLVHAHILARDL